MRVVRGYASHLARAGGGALGGALQEAVALVRRAADVARAALLAGGLALGGRAALASGLHARVGS